MLTIDEYLYELVKRTTLKRIDLMLNSIQAEESEPEDKQEKENTINMLYNLRAEFKRDVISKENEAVMKREVAKLKEAMTRTCDYSLKENLVVGSKELEVSDNYDFINKLFSENVKKICHDGKQKSL